MKREAGADADPEGRAVAFFTPPPYNGLHIGPE